METNQIMDEVTMTQTGETQGRETNVENLSSRKHPKRRKRIVFSIILVLVIAIGDVYKRQMLAELARPMR